MIVLHLIIYITQERLCNSVSKFADNRKSAENRSIYGKRVPFDVLFCDEHCYVLVYFLLR